MKYYITEPNGYPREARRILEAAGITETNSKEDADVLIVRLGKIIDDDYLSGTNVQYILSATTGTDHIRNTDWHKTKNITLKGDPVLKNIHATAELTFGLILALARHIPQAVNGTNREDFIGMDLAGKTIGILGYGRIGQMVEMIAYGFDMEVISCDKGHPLNHLLSESQILSIHVDLNPTTYNLIGMDEFRQLPKGALVINTSRGEVINEFDLLQALKHGIIGGAALDVMAHEQAGRNPALLEYARTHDNLIITPHIGGATRESMAMAEIAIAKRMAQEVQG